MQKKQVTVHVPTAITLMLEDENLTKEKIESMVNNTISEMSYDFSIDTNSCSYDDGRIGSIVETKSLAMKSVAWLTLKIPMTPPTPCSSAP
jgi:hypothetical protein